MCGIAGIIALNGTAPDPARVEAMLHRLEHRGPDDRGIWTSPNAVLGHTRLSIIDTQGSRQPFMRPGRTSVYNGEVFNYRDLRERLTGPWATSGDTEVIDRLLEQRGPHGLREVRGQFAIASWEQDEQRLTIARDAMGVLPVFWWQDRDFFVFASEVEALLVGLPSRPAIDRHGLSLYLGYRAVPAPRTMWEGVSKLPPGHALSLRPGDLGPQISDWRPAPPEPDSGMTFEDAVNTLRATLEEAVELALVADVPVGSYLSGGLDSSLIAALASRHVDGPLRTYCAFFGDPSTDETPWADLVAGHLGTQHVNVHVPAEDFVKDWPRLSLLRGAPVSEPSDVAINQLALAAAEDVKVVLSGEGSDELFAGYPKHALATLTRQVGLVPAPVRRSMTAGIARVVPSRGRKAVVALRALGERDEEARIRAWFASFTPAERSALLGQSFADPPLSSPPHADPLTRMLRHDQGAWLADNLLERGDRMTMGASVEFRPPFLDPRVVELSRRIPAKLHRHDNQAKAVVRAVARDLLPSAILDRPKSGFQVPIAQWLRGSLRDMLTEELLSPTSFCLTHLDPVLVKQRVEGHLSGRADESKALWTLLSLEVWANSVG